MKISKGALSLALLLGLSLSPCIVHAQNANYSSVTDNTTFAGTPTGTSTPTTVFSTTASTKTTNFMGSVGINIGTATPSQALQVTGGGAFSGSVAIGSLDIPSNPSSTTATAPTIQAANNLALALVGCIKQGGGSLSVTAQGILTCGTTTCLPTSKTQTVACPNGETGTDIQQQDYTCSGDTGTWGNWYDTSNTCAPIKGTTFMMYHQAQWYSGMSTQKTVVGDYYCGYNCQYTNKITGQCSCPAGTSPSVQEQDGSIGHEGCTATVYVCN